MTENVVTTALVNKKTGEVVEIGLSKTPDEIMLDAREAARAVEKLIESNKRKPLEFNGKRYWEFSHWQTVGKFYHCSVATGEASFVEVGGVKGFRAKAYVIDEKTGLTLGYAEAYCMTDEPNWKHKPLFQLASMAQTRAGSKCLSNKFRYVAIVAGYEPTPGEEMDMTTERNLQPPKEKVIENSIEFGKGPEAPVAPARTGGITVKQAGMLFAKSKAAGISEDSLKAYLWNTYQIEHTKDLRWQEMDNVLAWIDQQKTSGE